MKGVFDNEFWEKLKSLKSVEERVHAYIDHMDYGGTIGTSALINGVIHCSEKLYPTPDEPYDEALKTLCKVIRNLRKQGVKISGPTTPSRPTNMVTRL